MSIHVALNHLSRYTYDRPVALGPQVIRLRPAPHSRSRVLSYSMRITPSEHFLNWQQDPQSNWLARAVFPERITELAIEVDFVAEMAVFNPFDFFLEPHAERFPFSYDSAERDELAPYLARLPADLQLQLKQHVQVFLAEKPFLGCAGLAITDDMRVTIAALACLPLLNRPDAYYPGLRQVLVYPGPFIVDRIRIDPLSW